MARRHSVQEEETEINITPMLDIVFIMLIFFIVTTSFIKETGIDPDRPEAETAIKQERGNILIAINSVGDIWMNKRKVELGQVRQMVEQAKAESPEASVVFSTHRPLTLENGVKMSYGDLIATYGDFFLGDKPMGLPGTGKAEARRNFLQGFATMNAKSAAEQVTQGAKSAAKQITQGAKSAVSALPEGVQQALPTFTDLSQMCAQCHDADDVKRYETTFLPMYQFMFDPKSWVNPNAYGQTMQPMMDPETYTKWYNAWMERMVPLPGTTPPAEK